MFVSQRTSSMWQNAADDDLRRRPTCSRRPDRLEPWRTVTGTCTCIPGWPSSNPPLGALEPIRLPAISC